MIESKLTVKKKIQLIDGNWEANISGPDSDGEFCLDSLCYYTREQLLAVAQAMFDIVEETS